MYIYIFPHDVDYRNIRKSKAFLKKQTVDSQCVSEFTHAKYKRRCTAFKHKMLQAVHILPRAFIFLRICHADSGPDKTLKWKNGEKAPKGCGREYSCPIPIQQGNNACRIVTCWMFCSGCGNFLCCMSRSGSSYGQLHYQLHQ